MTGMPHLKVLRPTSPLDTLISFMTDAHSLLSQHTGWLAGEHPRAEAFVAEVLGPVGGVLEAASRSDREAAEARVATQVQDERIEAGAAGARRTRKTCQFIAAEIEAAPGGGDPHLAKRVRMAGGVGMRARLDRQSGVRRMLEHQVSSLPDLGALLEEWPRLVQRLEDGKELLAGITAAIKEQSDEALEADLAHDQLQDAMGAAVDQMNRVIQLVNIAEDEAPDALSTGLLSLQSHHPGVYYVSSVKAETETDSATSETPEA